MGRENMSEMAFLVMSLFACEASTPAYHASTTVRRIPKARMAMVIPSMVRTVRSLWRKAFLKSILRRSIEVTLFKLPYYMGLLSGPGVVRHHYDDFAELAVELFHQSPYRFSRVPVEVSGRLVCDQYGRVRHHRPCYGHPLLPAARKLARVVLHPFGKVHKAEKKSGPLLSFLSGESLQYKRR